MSNINLPDSHEAGVFFIAAIIASQAVWAISFQFGAYHTFSYDHLFMVLAASTAAMLASIIIYQTNEGEKYFSYSGSVVILLPWFWFGFGIYSFGMETDFSDIVNFALSILVLLVSLPYIAFLLLSAAVPELSEIKKSRYKLGLLFIILIVSLIGYVLGFYNKHIMTCADFSTQSPPENCYKSSKSFEPQELNPI